MCLQYCECIKSSIKFWDPLWIFSHKVDREKREDQMVFSMGELNN